MEKQAQIEKVMKHKTIPAGQLCIYKALLEADPAGLTLKELSAATDRSPREMASTLAGAGKRVTESIGEIEGKPSRLLIGKVREYYYLAPELLEFIKATPELESALSESDMSKFLLHTKEAWRFVWDENKTSGKLQLFERPAKRVRTRARAHQGSPNFFDSGPT